jgi:glycosyltransferase involved in cell wall biosynthesis
LKVSIITVCYNADKTIERTISSVLAQRYQDIEYIVIDGASRDHTLQIIKKYEDRISNVVSEPDNGMYDALNKGIRLATGDIVGILNADDEFMHNDVISRIVDTFNKDKDCQAVIGDIIFLNYEGQVKRYYSAKRWSPSRFASGFMPPHPSFYCRREMFEKIGYYRTDFDIAADYELLIRFFKVNAVPYKYIPEVLVAMKMGGISTGGFRTTIKINKEIYRACRLNGVSTNYLRLYSKYLWKILEYIRKP